MNVTDFAFACELFVVIFGVACWLLSSSQHEVNQPCSTSSVDPLNETNRLSPVMSAQNDTPNDVLPDPWHDDLCVNQDKITVSPAYSPAFSLPQLCLPAAKKDVALDVLLMLVSEELTVAKAKKVLTIFTEKYQLEKPKSKTRKAELLNQIKAYLHQSDYRPALQGMVCNVIGGRL